MPAPSSCLEAADPSRHPPTQPGGTFPGLTGLAGHSEMGRLIYISWGCSSRAGAKVPAARGPVVSFARSQGLGSPIHSSLGSELFPPCLPTSALGCGLGRAAAPGRKYGCLTCQGHRPFLQGWLVRSLGTDAGGTQGPKGDGKVQAGPRPFDLPGGD